MNCSQSYLVLQKQRTLNFSLVRLELIVLLTSMLIMTCDAQNQEEGPFSFMWIAISIAVISVLATVLALTGLLCYFYVYKERCTTRQSHDDISPYEDVSFSTQPSQHLLFHTQWTQSGGDDPEEWRYDCDTRMSERWVRHMQYKWAEPHSCWEYI